MSTADLELGTVRLRATFGHLLLLKTWAFFTIVALLGGVSIFAV